VKDVRFIHEHSRDPREVERLAAYVLSKAKGVPPLAIKVEDAIASGHTDYPSGRASWGSRRAKWARDLFGLSTLGYTMCQVVVRLVSDEAPCLAQPRVCWHSRRAANAAYDPEGGNGYQPEVTETYLAGNLRFGRWPIYVTDTWQEAFVHTFAHEVSHTQQWQHSPKRASEVQCETFATRVLNDFKKEVNTMAVDEKTNDKDAEQAILDEKVAPLFSGDEQTAAIRYGRKLLRKQAGTRASAPPLSGISREQANQISEALGIQVKASAPAEPEEAAAAEQPEREAKPDPKPTPRKSVKRKR
jgi:hypothetical protein